MDLFGFSVDIRSLFVALLLLILARLAALTSDAVAHALFRAIGRFARKFARGIGAFARVIGLKVARWFIRLDDQRQNSADEVVTVSTEVGTRTSEGAPPSSQ